MSDYPVICLMGPTASGKSAIAIELVQHFPLEIISVDSAMVYRGMDIGTAKPTATQLAHAPHRLIDIRDPSVPYSAGDFLKDAHREITAIRKLGKVPLLTGGTMLYFHALTHGLASMPKADPKIRDALQQEALQQGWDYLHARLANCDPVAASRIHPSDKQRIQRALEVFLLSGKPISAWQTMNSDPLPGFKIHAMALAPPDRETLHARIEQRFIHMLEQGLIEEVKKLFDRGDLTLNTPAIRSVGYAQVWEYLLGHDDYHTMQTKAIIATRQLAKRQLTWLKRWPNLTWFNQAENQDQEIASWVVKRV